MKIVFQKDNDDVDGMQVGNRIVWKSRQAPQPPQQAPQRAPPSSSPVGVVSGTVERRQAPRPMPTRGRVIMQRPPSSVPNEYPTSDGGGPIREYVNPPADGENMIIERMSGETPDLVSMKAIGSERSGQFLSVADLQAMGEKVEKGVNWAQGASEAMSLPRPESPPVQGPPMIPNAQTQGNVPPPLDLNKPAPLPQIPGTVQWVPPTPPTPVSAPVSATPAEQPVVQEVKTP